MNKGLNGEFIALRQEFTDFKKGTKEDLTEIKVMLVSMNDKLSILPVHEERICKIEKNHESITQKLWGLGTLALGLLGKVILDTLSGK